MSTQLDKLFFCIITMHMKHSSTSNVRKMLIRQCVIVLRIGDEEQKRDAEFFKRVIEQAEIPQRRGAAA